MVVDKRSFLEFLNFPGEWLQHELYSDELYEIQLECILKEISKENLKKRIVEKEKYGLGSEHYRYGAFWWVMKKKPSLLTSLRLAVEEEPDEFLKKAMLNDLRCELNLSGLGASVKKS